MWPLALFSKGSIGTYNKQGLLLIGQAPNILSWKETTNPKHL